MGNIKYKVTLTAEEREKLSTIVKTGKTQGYKIRHAQILLALDEVPENKHWIDKTIAQAYQTTEKTIGNIRKRFVEQGFQAALDRHQRPTPPSMIKIDGDVEARLMVLAASDAPEGRSRWTLQLLANKLVEEGAIESISATAVGTTLKKMKLSLG